MVSSPPSSIVPFSTHALSHLGIAGSHGLFRSHHFRIRDASWIEPIGQRPRIVYHNNKRPSLAFAFWTPSMLIHSSYSPAHSLLRLHFTLPAVFVQPLCRFIVSRSFSLFVDCALVCTTKPPARCQPRPSMSPWTSLRNPMQKFRQWNDRGLETNAIRRGLFLFCQQRNKRPMIDQPMRGRRSQF